MTDASLVEVALPLPLDNTFTYRVEGKPPQPGTRVLVPFRREERIGWVVGKGRPPAGARIRSVLDVLDEEPSVSPDIMDLARWMAGYYMAPLGIALRTSVPAVLVESTRHLLTLVPSPAVESDVSAREEKIVRALEGTGGPRSVRALRRELGMGSLWPEIRRLRSRGRIRHEVVPPTPPSVRTRKVVELVRWLEDLQELEGLFGRAHRQRECYGWLEAAGGEAELSAVMEVGGFSRSVVSGLEARGVAAVVDREVMRDPFRDDDVPAPPSITPNTDQAGVIRELLRELSSPEPAPVLLHGITGSGKTLVYIELLKEVVSRRGRSGIVLVPEIALTPQTVSRFRAHFGDSVAVLHSGLSDGERYDAWRQLRDGSKRIAVGARSAIFAPVTDLGAIIVDEEHEGTYKQSEAPRYHGRDLAVMRAAKAGALCLLGSATPSLESWANAKSDKYRLMSLPERAEGQPLPPVRVVDLRADRKGTSGARTASPREGGGVGSVLSPPLVEAVRRRLEKGEQSILLLNRRGYSSFVQCRECGDVRSCLHCSISLTYHRVSRRLLCHHCRHEEPAPTRCERCGSSDLSFRGLGTEQVERVVTETFPDARVARMDVDTTSGKWAHHEILGRVGRGEVDILLGTQMIAKGLDFPRVTLVGVVNADVGIHLPDFRASERTFQLLSQVAGRTGRGELGGEVIIQTALPDHYAIRYAVSHDFPAFAERELKERRSPPYPPHVRMVNVVLSSPDAERAARAAEEGAAWLRRWQQGVRSPLEVIGPAPSPIERLHGRWRWHFLFRASRAGDVGKAARALTDGFTPGGGGDVRVALDRDPVALL
jgi:primosomal protein N' (replication factor Y)